MSIRHPGEDFFTQLHFFRAAEPRPTTAAAANGRREPPLNEPEAEPRRPAPSCGRTAGLTTRAPAVRSPRPYPCPCPRQACTHSKIGSRAPAVRCRRPHCLPLPALRTGVHCSRRLPGSSWAPRRPFLRPPLQDVTEYSSPNLGWLSPIPWSIWLIPVPGFPGLLFPSSFSKPSPFLSFHFFPLVASLTRFTDMFICPSPGDSLVRSWVAKDRVLRLSHSHAFPAGQELSPPPRLPRDTHPVEIRERGYGALPGPLPR